MRNAPTSIIRALLVDDEALSSKLMCEMLSLHPEVEVVGVAENLEAAAHLARAHEPNVVFLDIQLNQRSGFELLPQLNALHASPFVVFVTAFEEYAIAAFEQNALDYLLKPVHPSRLANTLTRLCKALSPGVIPDGESAVVAPPDDLSEAPTVRMGSEDVEVLKDGRTAFYLKANQIQAVQAEGSYTRILFANNQSCMVKRAIGQWEQRLPEGMFLKASRSLLLDPKSVVKMQSLNRNETEVFLEGRAEPIRLSRLESLRIKQTL